MNFIRLFSVLILLVSISNCSSTESKKNEVALPAQAPPPPTKKPEEPFWRCTILNGEGRTFIAQDTTSFAAEGRAKRECQMNYRHCTLLKCDHVTE